VRASSIDIPISYAAIAREQAARALCQRGILERAMAVNVAIDDAAAPGIVRRAATRFALIAFGLYHVPLFLNNYPSLGGGGFLPDGLSRDWGHVFGQVGLWVARNVFGMDGPMPQALEGDNGDTAEEYCRLLVAIVIGAIAAAVWTFVDRRRPRAAWVEDSLRVLLRYSIVLGLASYAIAKLLPVQFWPLDAASLEPRVGELDPFGLLWNTMRYSRLYSTFGGVLETLVIALLCFRRTALLGALLCVPVMVNVAMMNFCYGVPVKLYSSMMVASALVLVAFDAPRVLDVLVFHRATPAAPPRPPFRSRALNLARWPVKVLVVGSVVASSVHAMVTTPIGKTHPLAGAWEPTSFIRAELEPDHEIVRWRRFAIGRFDATVRLDGGALVICRIQGEPPKLVLACTDHHGGELAWTRADNALRLDGTFDGAAVSITLERRDSSRLLDTPFTWIFD
jgi:hypothetical protein